MVAMSLLRPAFGQSLRIGMLQGSILVLRNQLAHKPLTAVVTRHMGSHNKMQVLPSRFEWERFKNDVHFYLLLGFIPMGLLIMCANLFIGQAELKDIQDGCEPMPWEYFKGPIERWFAEKIYDFPEKRYERTLHVLWEESEKVKLRKLEKRVKALAHDRQDYKGWYYTPMDKTRLDAALKGQKEWREDHTGTRL